jgi:hypothetical protein
VRTGLGAGCTIVGPHSGPYPAESWNCSRRVVVKVEWHCDELFPRVGFIVTNMDTAAEDRVINFYNGRGTAEQWIKEGKYALKWTRLSCHRFLSNQVRLQLFALAYNLGNFLRRLALPQGIRHWSLTTLREKLIKIGAKFVQQCRVRWADRAGNWLHDCRSAKRTLPGYPAIPNEWAQKPNSFPFDSNAFGVDVTSSPYFLLSFPKPNF